MNETYFRDKKHKMINLLIKQEILLKLLMFTVVLFLANAALGYNEATATATATSAFLGPIYYGNTSISAVFDHDAPIYGGDGNNNEYVRHNDGTLYENVLGFQYDEHQGVDYSLAYRPVLGGADGTVAKAGWFDVSIFVTS